MPAPRTETYEPKKVYFSPSEALKILDCSRHWLSYWTRQMGFKSVGRNHRYTVDEINRLTVIRKTNGIHRNTKTGQFSPIPFKRKPGRKRNSDQKNLPCQPKRILKNDDANH